MSYYETKADGKCHGTIHLKDCLSVEEAEPQVVPLLKPGENSFFFNVSTCAGGWLPWAVYGDDRGN